MKIVEYVQLDAKDGNPTTKFPARHGGVNPLPIEQVLQHRLERVDGYDHVVSIGATAVKSIKGVVGVIRELGEKEVSSLLESIRSEKLTSLNNDFNRLHEELSENYPEREQSTFYVQREEAKEVLSGGVDTFWIDAASEERGVTREELANSILSRDSVFRGASGRISGKRQAQRDYILGERDIITLSRFSHSWE